VIDYNTNTMETIMEQLVAAPGCPYSIVLDCVTSADVVRGDSSRIDYRILVQQMKARDMLTDDYVHRRLGGPTRDWIRAGWERIMTGSSADTATNASNSSSLSSCCADCCWSFSHEKLFWIRLPHSSRQLQILQQMVQSSPKDDASSYKKRKSLKVYIQDVYPMTAEHVNRAFQQILSRRVQGKIVISVHHNGDNYDNDDCE
jgi:hypothetical protein